MDAPKEELSEKHLAFCEEYLQCWNQTEAYCRVYPGSSREAAMRSASTLMRKHEVRAYLENRLRDKVMSSDEVLARLSEQARGSLEAFTFVNEDGFAYFDFGNQEAKDNMPLIKKMKTKRSRRVEGKGKDAEVWEDEFIEVELHDAQKALELIGRHYKLFGGEIEEGAKLIVDGLAAVLDKVYGNTNNQSGQ